MNRYLDRQAQAHEELGHTEVSAAVARALVAACLLILVAVPIARNPLAAGGASPFVGFGDAVGRAFAEPGPLAANRAALTAIDELERHLEDHSLLMELALPTAQWLLTGWGGVGNEEAYCGSDGWLYLRPGIDYLTGPGFLSPAVLERRRRAAPSWERPPAPDPRPAIVDFHRQLAARGIRFLVLPAPTKAMVHPEPLSGRRASLRNPSFAAFRSALEEAGVLVFDPTATLIRARQSTAGDVFLRTDSHWSPAGVDAVARELADRIRLLDLPFAGDPVAFRRQSREHRGTGDLVRTLRLPAGQRLYPPERVEILQVAGGPLVDPAEAEILVLGDSFTNVYSQAELGWGRAAGLAEQLSFHLGRPVARIAVNAGGAYASRQRLAQAAVIGRDPLARARLVVFEFAVRELAVGDWQKTPLPQVAVR